MREKVFSLDVCLWIFLYLLTLVETSARHEEQRLSKSSSLRFAFFHVLSLLSVSSFKSVIVRALWGVERLALTSPAS